MNILIDELSAGRDFISSTWTVFQIDSISIIPFPRNVSICILFFARVSKKSSDDFLSCLLALQAEYTRLDAKNLMDIYPLDSSSDTILL